MHAPALPLLLRSTTGWVFVDLRSILCLRAEDKYARLHRTDGSSLVVLHTLNDLEARIGCNARIGDLLFVRAHRSSIVAIHHACAIHDHQEIEFRNGERISFSRRLWPFLRELAGSIHATPSALHTA